jgi:hypothetical protein
MSTIFLLALSNVFMTFAWYGHLKYGHDWRQNARDTGPALEALALLREPRRNETGTRSQ